MPRKNAYIMLRPGVERRREAFMSGCQRLGYATHLCVRESGAIIGVPAEGEAGDILISWNRGGHFSRICDQFERGGGRVVVAENGYLGVDKDGHQFYAIAMGGHNGSGQWHIGGAGRWEALGIELKPWRRTGEHVLVCSQRSIGSPTMRMPTDWPQAIQKRLKEATRRPIRHRMHPGNPTCPRHRIPLGDDLKNAWCVVVWTSGCANPALVAGIPVFYCGPAIIAARAAKRGISDIENPNLGDRMPAMIDLAWAQWSCSEIATGEPFRRLGL